MLSGFTKGLQIWPPILNGPIFLVNEMRRFWWFFQKFSENSNYKIILKTWSSQPCSWVLSVLLRIANYDCSNPCTFWDMTFFVIFQKNFRKLILIFFRKSWNSQPCSWVVSGYSKVLQILPPNMTVQILVVFEIWRFFVIFFKKFSETYINFFIRKC